jgi:preprotein translocase subunit SecG
MLEYVKQALLLLFALISLLLILVILIQKGRGGGLASAFGGGSGTATAFGSKTGDVLTWATSIMFGLFLLLAIILNLITNSQSGSSKSSMGTSGSGGPTSSLPLTSGGSTTRP